MASQRPHSMLEDKEMRRLHTKALAHEPDTMTYWSTRLERDFTTDAGWELSYAWDVPDHIDMIIELERYRAYPYLFAVTDVRYDQGGARRLERLALRNAQTCLTKGGFETVYAVTTSGLTFRTWSVSVGDNALTPLFGGPPGSDDEYFEVWSPEASREWARFVQRVLRERNTATAAVHDEDAPYMYDDDDGGAYIGY